MNLQIGLGCVLEYKFFKWPFDASHVGRGGGGGEKEGRLVALEDEF